MPGFLRKAKLLQTGGTILHFHQQCVSFCCSPSLQAFDIVSVLDIRHSIRCFNSIYLFSLGIPFQHMTLSILLYVFLPFYIFFHEMSVYIFSYFNCVVCFLIVDKISLCILDTSSLSCFAKILFQSVILLS